MSGYVLRRSLLSMSVLLGILVLAGGLLVALTSVPFEVPLVLGLLWVGAQYWFAPAVIGRLIRARELVRTADGYEPRSEEEARVAPIAERRCRAAGIPLVRLGIVDDGTPNAFTFGRTRRDARLYVTRGLLERLDDRELEAVVGHETGHVANRDFVVMTLASVVPMVLYFVVIGARGANRGQAAIVAVVAWVGYLLSLLAVLALGRARELAADHASCAATGDGDALCSALVKVAYGIGRANRDRAQQIQRLRQDKERKQAGRLVRRGMRVQSASMLGIADSTGGAALVDAYEAAEKAGLPPERVVGALRWDACNPWGRFSEFLSGHPLVLHRIAALESSGLPGAPTDWHAAEVEGSCAGPEVTRARRRFAVELPVRYLGFAAVTAAVVVFRAGGHHRLLAVLLLAAGVLLGLRALMRTPPWTPRPVDGVSSLLERLDAGPMTGLPVSVRGRVVGRGMPGYALSPDLVVADDSGFVAVLYRQPLPFGRTVFALAKAGRYADQEVLVHGWYRREPGPVLELRSITAADGTRSRSWQYTAAYLVAGVLAVVGALMFAAT